MPARAADTPEPSDSCLHRGQLRLNVLRRSLLLSFRIENEHCVCKLIFITAYICKRAKHYSALERYVMLRYNIVLSHSIDYEKNIGGIRGKTFCRIAILEVLA